MQTTETVATLRRHGLPGRLIVADGLNGAGKTTMLGLIADELARRGLDVVRTRQPTSEARELAAFKQFLFEPEKRDAIDYRALLCMMIGDRLQHSHQVIKPALAEGKIVLCDRYIYTQMVTTVTRGYVDEPWMYELYQHVLEPDLALLFDVPVEVAAARVGSRDHPVHSYVELAHLAANLEEYRRVAARYDLTVIDTSHEDHGVAFGKLLPHLEAALPARS